MGKCGDASSRKVANQNLMDHAATCRQCRPSPKFVLDSMRRQFVWKERDMNAFDLLATKSIANVRLPGGLLPSGHAGNKVCVKVSSENGPIRVTGL